MADKAGIVRVNTAVPSHMPQPLIAFAARVGPGNGIELRAGGVSTPGRAGGPVAAACDRESRSTTPTGEAGETGVRHQTHGSSVAVHRYQWLHGIHGDVRAAGIEGYREVLEDV